MPPGAAAADRPCVGWITAVVLVLEVGIIDLQAARGVTSHFNAATALDAVLFAVMGIAILVLWVAAIALTVALFRHRFADASFGWALRLGMLLTVIGQATGGLMTIAVGRATRGRALAPACTSPARTPSAALTAGRDCRSPAGAASTAISASPHFVGIHAVQLLPAHRLAASGPLGAAWRRAPCLLAAAGYYALFAILLAQALGGHPLVPTMVSR